MAKNVKCQEKPGHTDRNCFQPKKVGAVNTGQRNDRKVFRRHCQQSGQSGNYRNEIEGSDANETSLKTVHESSARLVSIPVTRVPGRYPGTRVSLNTRVIFSQS